MRGSLIFAINSDNFITEFRTNCDILCWNMLYGLVNIIGIGFFEGRSFMLGCYLMIERSTSGGNRANLLIIV